MDNVFQSNYFNPAYQPLYNISVGVPLLSSFYINYSNNGFSYDDIFPKKDNKRYLDLDNFIAELNTINYLTFDLNTELLTFGFRFKSFYFSFGITEKISFALGLPEDLFKFAWRGNTPFYDGTFSDDGIASFKNLGVDINYYREYAYGVSKTFDLQHVFGARIKLLYGKMNFNSLKTDIGIQTDPEEFDLTLYSQSELNSSFPVVLPNDNFTNIYIDDYTPLGLALNRKNWGAALDLGFTYIYDEKFDYSASIINFGMIKWRTYLNNITQDASYTFDGFNLSEDISTGKSFTDSLLAEFELSRSNNKYTTFLPFQILVGGKYKLNSKMFFGLLSRNLVFQKRIFPSLTASVNTNFFKFLTLSLSYSYINNTYNNAGLGLSLHSKKFQFYLINDNVWGMIKPLESRNINLRFGFNMYFGGVPPPTPKYLQTTYTFVNKRKERRIARKHAED